MQIPPTLWPEQFTLDNFRNLFDNMAFGTYLGNTLVIVFFSFFGLFLNAMAGYGFAKGAGEFRTFLQIVLPISSPILAVPAILTFIGGWNSFLWPLIIANDDKLYTLSVGLSLLKGQNENAYALQMAGSAFMVIPIVLIFIMFQKYIIDNYTISGIK